MKLFYFPGACSLGIHVLLEEIGASYEAVLLDLRSGAHKAPEYVALNPKSKVPALVRDNGRVLTEWPAIAFYLANLHPQAGLLPTDVDAAADAVSAVEYIVSTMHMQAFARMYRPERFAVSEADFDSVRAQGKDMFLAGLEMMGQILQGREFLAGDRFSIADAALLFVTFWAARGELPLPASVAAHFARMKQRASVQTVFAREGLAL